MTDRYAMQIPHVSVREPHINPLRASSRGHRKAVAALARFFAKEHDFSCFGYDVDGHEDNEKDAAFLWLGEEQVREVVRGDTVLRVLRPAVGACSFRWVAWDDGRTGFELEWVWFHPFARRRGHLTKAWPGFEKEFGPFEIQPPISLTMRAFLAKVRWVPF